MNYWGIRVPFLRYGLDLRCYVISVIFHISEIPSPSTSGHCGTIQVGQVRSKCPLVIIDLVMRHHFLSALNKGSIVDNPKVLLLLRLSGSFKSAAPSIRLGC